MKDRFREIVKRIPRLGKVYRQRDELRGVVNRLWVEPGHFYSPIPAIDELRLKEAEIFGRDARELPGIELNEARQLAWLDRLAAFYPELPFKAERQAGLRYFFDNPAYSYFDAVVFYGVLRHLRPRRVVEVGSGYSSCLLLDTNELFFDNQIECSFIEPYPQLLESLITDDDRRRVHVIPRKLEEVDRDLFTRLEAGDILFIDSSHVSKTNSDVNCAFFDILPLLRSGVYVHFHDVCYPFEYPREWVFQGRAWNEAYLLRAFLQYNREFEIEIFNSFLGRFHRERLARELPLSVAHADGNVTASGLSIWLRRTESA